MKFLSPSDQSRRMKYKAQFVFMLYCYLSGFKLLPNHHNCNKVGLAFVLISPLQFSCEGSVEQKPHPLVASGREFSLTPACRVVHQPLHKNKIEVLMLHAFQA